ncbi:MAG: hypothetical protein N2691_01505 [Patescibacteria group bacterium]|nr:hypothetical protein [Patescibacteria group bacterium]
MRNCLYQNGDGSIAISSLMFVLLGIVMLGFVIESGRLVQAASHAENSTNLAGLAGVTRYTDTFLKKLEETYDSKKPEAEMEIRDEADAAGEILTPEEFKERVIERTKEKVATELAVIRSAARRSCISGATEILEENKLIVESVTCSDTDVVVEGYVRYSPFIAAPGFKPGKISRRDSVGIAISTP